jgi:hypothetical protein
MLAIAGCGSDGGKSDAVEPAKMAYVAQADGICERQQAKREELEGRVGDLAPMTPPRRVPSRSTTGSRSAGTPETETPET